MKQLTLISILITSFIIHVKTDANEVPFLLLCLYVVINTIYGVYETLKKQSEKSEEYGSDSIKITLSLAQEMEKLGNPDKAEKLYDMISDLAKQYGSGQPDENDDPFQEAWKTEFRETEDLKPKRIYSGEEMRNCELGIYQIFWNEGGYSLATIGNMSDGVRWIAAVNWTATSGGNPTGLLNNEMIADIKSIVFLSNKSLIHE